MLSVGLVLGEGVRGDFSDGSTSQGSVVVAGLVSVGFLVAGVPSTVMVGLMGCTSVSVKSWRAAVLSVGTGGEARRGLVLQGMLPEGDDCLRLGVLGALGGSGAWGRRSSVVSIPNSSSLSSSSESESLISPIGLGREVFLRTGGLTGGGGRAASKTWSISSVVTVDPCSSCLASSSPARRWASSSCWRVARLVLYVRSSSSQTICCINSRVVSRAKSWLSW